MKAKMVILVILLALVVQAGFVKGIIEERNKLEYDKLAEQVNACMENGDYAAAIPLLKIMHTLKPQELIPIEYLGILYANIPEEKPELTNALLWLLEAEKRNSTNNMVYYNLACIYSLRNDLENAVKAMNKTIIFDYSNFEWMSQDDDLVNFRTTAWWKDIADNYEQIEYVLNVYKEFADSAADFSIEERLGFYSIVD